MYELNLSPAFRADESRYADFTEMAEALPAPRETIELQVQAIVAHDTSARLPGIATPTLVIHGTDDGVLGYPNGALIASLIPGARLETFEDVGHMFWWEQPQRSAELVREHALASPPESRAQSSAFSPASAQPAGSSLPFDLEDVVGLGDDFGLVDDQLQRRVVLHPGVDRVLVFGAPGESCVYWLMIR